MIYRVCLLLHLRPIFWGCQAALLIKAQDLQHGTLLHACAATANMSKTNMMQLTSLAASASAERRVARFVRPKVGSLNPSGPHSRALIKANSPTNSCSPPYEAPAQPFAHPATAAAPASDASEIKIRRLTARCYLGCDSLHPLVELLVLVGHCSQILNRQHEPVSTNRSKAKLFSCIWLAFLSFAAWAEEAPKFRIR